MSATPFADQRTTAGDTFIGRSRIIYNFGFCKPLCIPSHEYLTLGCTQGDCIEKDVVVMTSKEKPKPTLKRIATLTMNGIDLRGHFTRCNFPLSVNE